MSHDDIFYPHADYSVHVLFISLPAVPEPQGRPSDIAQPPSRGGCLVVVSRAAGKGVVADAQD